MVERLQLTARSVSRTWGKPCANPRFAVQSWRTALGLGRSRFDMDLWRLASAKASGFASKPIITRSGFPAPLRINIHRSHFQQPWLLDSSLCPLGESANLGGHAKLDTKAGHLVARNRPHMYLQRPLLTPAVTIRSTISNMAPAQVALPASLPQAPPPSAAPDSWQGTQHRDDEPIRTVDALVRHRARLHPDAIIVSYPSSGVDFIDYSMRQLDVFAYRVARHYQTFIPIRTSSKVSPTTVAVLGPSNFDYLVTMLALTKLGHTVLFLSTRISQLAVESLIETTGATYLLADTRFLQLASEVQTNNLSLQVSSIAESSHFDFPIEIHADTRMDHQLDPAIEEANNIYIIHSSGT
jgi:hypothetical protein